MAAAYASIASATPTCPQLGPGDVVHRRTALVVEEMADFRIGVPGREFPPLRPNINLNEPSSSM